MQKGVEEKGVEEKGGKKNGECPYKDIFEFAKELDDPVLRAAFAKIGEDPSRLTKPAPSSEIDPGIGDEEFDSSGYTMLYGPFNNREM
jgi:hypothetical protein